MIASHNWEDWLHLNLVQATTILQWVPNPTHRYPLVPTVLTQNLQLCQSLVLLQHLAPTNPQTQECCRAVGGLLEVGTDVEKNIYNSTNVKDSDFCHFNWLEDESALGGPHLPRLFHGCWEKETEEQSLISPL